MPRRAKAQRELDPDAISQLSLERKAELISESLRMPNPSLDLGWQMAEEV